jgi:hypothetical protein
MVYGDLRCEGDAVFFKIVLAPEYITESYQQEKELLAVLEACDKFVLDEDELFLYQEGKLKLSFMRDTYNIQ